MPATVSSSVLTTWSAENNIGNSGASATVDWTQAQSQKITLTANATLAFTAPAGPCSIWLKVVQDATGSRTVTWPGTVIWAASSTLKTAAAATDIILFYWDGTNYYGTLVTGIPTSGGTSPVGANVVTSESTTSTTYVDLTTIGPSVTMTTGTTAIVAMSAIGANTALNENYISFAVSGATTLAAADNNGTHVTQQVANDNAQLTRVFYLSGLTAGSNTFKLQYRVQAGTCTFANRSIAVFFI